MKQLILMIGLVVLLGTNADAFAGGVFKCVGVDGELTFSFQPCAAAPTPEPVADEPALPSRSDTLARLDSDIASLKRQLELAKENYEALLAQFTGSRTDELTADFDDVTSTLFAKLNQLHTERSRVAQL